MKVQLTDTNIDVVNAWRDYFDDCANVSIYHGSIVPGKYDAIVSPSNSYGHMDGGIDLVYLRHFGKDLQARAYERIKRKLIHKIEIGKAIGVDTGNIDIPMLIMAPTMERPMDVHKTENALQAFYAALSLASDMNVNLLACPGLCTLTGCMHPMVSAFQMRQAYDLWVREFGYMYSNL